MSDFLGLYPSSRFGVPAVAALTGLTIAEARAALDDLVDRNWSRTRLDAIPTARPDAAVLDRSVLGFDSPTTPKSTR